MTLTHYLFTIYNLNNLQFTLTLTLNVCVS